MQAAGGELEVAAEDLTPQELAAFHRALADGELSGAVPPWQPWWLSEDAARLELGAGGTALVAEQHAGAAGPGREARQAPAMSQQQPAQQQHQQQAPSPPGQVEGQARASVMPPPPSRPLPPLAALTRAAPSPLLGYQLLDLLYAYCLTLRRYNGDYQWEAADAADTLFALSAVLAAASTGAATASSSSGGAAAAQAGDGAAPVLLGCVQRACQPPVGSRDARGFAVSVVSDVAAILQLGRPVVLTALMDATRLVEAARQQLEAGQGVARGGISGSDGDKEQRQASHWALVWGMRLKLSGCMPPGVSGVAHSICSSGALAWYRAQRSFLLSSPLCRAAFEAAAAPPGGCRTQAALLPVLG